MTNMTSTINLTKFLITPELQGFGVANLSKWKEQQEIRNLLFFPTPPTEDMIRQRVGRLGEIALNEATRTGSKQVLISCPPWMARALCSELTYHDLTPVVSFTKKTHEDGIKVIDLVAVA